MKKYAFTLLLLLAIGIGLTYQLFSQEQKLDQTVFLETTKSIRYLQTLDKSFAVSLSQSRFNPGFDLPSLSDKNYEISEEFDHLRYEALFEEIEGSPELSTAVENFENQFLQRDEELESYIDINQSTNDSLSLITTLNKKIEQQAAEGSITNVETNLSIINAAIFRLALNTEPSSAPDESSGTEPSSDVDEPVDAEPSSEPSLSATSENTLALLLATFEQSNDAQAYPEYQQYKNAVNKIQNNALGIKTLYNSLSSLKTGPLLDSVEVAYTDYHNSAITSSNQFRDALIVYGLILLAALLVFAYQIRKNYNSMEAQVAKRTEQIETAYSELKESQEQLIQSEKMASLGQMVAGVAHEVNTPLGYVTSNIETLNSNVSELGELVTGLDHISTAIYAKNKDSSTISKNLISTVKLFKKVGGTELLDESKQLLTDGKYGLQEISKLVTSLKDFARLERRTTEQIDIHNCLQSSLTISSNQIRKNNVTVVKKYGDVPKITCSPSKLNQLFLNIITNSCQAMSNSGGYLTVSTAYENDLVKIGFQDQGVGMDAEIQEKMFDPFFTTKEIGEGTGLGMSIAYKIVEAHKGKIDVQSIVGEGTTVTVSLPVK